MDDDALDRALGVLERLVQATERSAAAQERLNDLADSQRLPEPSDVEAALFDAPACPHCGALDPGTQSPGGEGRLSEFVLATPCMNCGKPFYAIPVGWRIARSPEEAKKIMEASPTDEG